MRCWYKPEGEGGGVSAGGRRRKEDEGEGGLKPEPFISR